MTRWVWFVLRAGARVGIIAGTIVGLIAGFGGSLLTSSLADNATLAATIFLLLMILLPVVFYVSLLGNPSPAKQVQVRAAIAWLPAILLGVVVFMMPIVIVPLVLNKGVTFENSSDWYAQVYDTLGIGRVLLVAVVSAVGFVLAARIAPTA
ncbi:MAG: hypothetical protein SGI73_22285 [Chloroflexota bacterium]|nr:hypothetical protein [Chloroflexota bacterium]